MCLTMSCFQTKPHEILESSKTSASVLMKSVEPLVRHHIPLFVGVSELREQSEDTLVVP